MARKKARKKLSPERLAASRAGLKKANEAKAKKLAEDPEFGKRQTAAAHAAGRKYHTPEEAAEALERTAMNMVHGTKPVTSAAVLKRAGEIRKAFKNDATRKEAVSRALARKSLLHFIQRSQPGYKAGWVHKIICKELEKFAQDVVDKKSPRLILTVPPRHGKSLIASQFFPAWHLGNHPEHEFIVAAYSQSLPVKFSRKTREVVRTKAYKGIFPKFAIHPEIQSAEEWATTLGGSYITAGVSGGITGKGCNCVSFQGLITTTAGDIPAYKLVEMLEDGVQPPDLLSWAHGSLQKGKINAAATRITKSYYKIKFEDGVEASLTGEHPVCVGFDEGYPVYRRVDDLREGEGVVKLEGGPGCHTTKDEDLRGVSDVQDRIHEVPRQVLPGGAREKELDSHLLRQLSGALSGFFSRSKSRVRGMWEGVSDYSVNWAEAMLNKMFGGISVESNTGGEPPYVQPGHFELFPLREGVRKEEISTSSGQEQTRVLFSPLLRGVDEREEFLLTQGNGHSGDEILPRRVQEDEKEAAYSQRYLRGLRRSGEPAAPSGRGQGEQRPGKLGYSMQALPHNTPHEATTTKITSIELITKSLRVVDFEVDNTHAFCANSIQTLNCLVVDDPVKNREDAESDTIRQTAKDWFTSTAYTRLAPGGGILVIMCMTGDTPVLMADGTEKWLGSLEVGEEVATYNDGALTTSRVLNHRSNGYDSCFKITTSSGRIVRANERHPFLVLEDGELRWTRMKNLKLTQQIVGLKDNMVSGKGRFVRPKVVANRPHAEGSAPPTTIRPSGLVGIAHRLNAAIHRRVSALSSSIGTVLPSMITNASSLGREECALFVGPPRKTQITPLTGTTSYVSTTTTTPAIFAGSSATDVTSLSGEELPLKFSKQLSNTSDFTTEEIVSVEECGFEEVFDIEIEGTENFIANGLVSHNTRWHHADLAGWLLEQKAKGETADDWKLINFPAAATDDEWLLPDNSIMLGGDLDALDEVERAKILATASHLRTTGAPLHAARYGAAALERIRRAVGPRDWAALYQQQPTPDEGDYVDRSWFRYVTPPSFEGMTHFIAGDLAIGKKQQNDYTCFGVWSMDWDGNLHLRAVVRKRMSTFECVETLLDLCEQFDVHIVGIENGALKLALNDQLELRMKERRVFPAFDNTLTPISDKAIRGRTFQGLLQAGVIYYPEDRPAWLDVVETESLQFPNGKYDDTFDMQAWAARMAKNISRPKKPGAKKPKSWKAKLGKFIVGAGSAGSHMAS